MKILIINFEYPPLGGGGGVATRDMAEELAKRHEVHVITTRFTHLPAKEICDGVYVHRVKVWGRRTLPTATLLSLITFVPSALLIAWRLTAQISFDIINAQFVIPSGIPAAIVSLVHHIPLVVSFIGGDIYDPTKGTSPHRFWVLRYLIRIIARQAILATAISEDTKQRAVALHNVAVPITVTPLGVTLTPTLPASRAELGLPQQEKVFISIGRLIPRKGFGLLLRIWPHVREAHLVIIGDGPLMSELVRQRDELGLRARVHLVGFVSEIRKIQLLHAASAYISATTHEGFGIVFLEAMVAGLPIIATDNGGQTDFLENNRNALLVPANDEQALISAIHRLGTDVALRKAMVVANREKVVEYSIDKTTRRFEEVLLKAAQLKSSN